MSAPHHVTVPFSFIIDDESVKITGKFSVSHLFAKYRVHASLLAWGCVCSLFSRLVGNKVKVSHPISVHKLGPDLVPMVPYYITEPRPPQGRAQVVLGRVAILPSVPRGVSSALGVREVRVHAYFKSPENMVEGHEIVPCSWQLGRGVLPMTTWPQYSLNNQEALLEPCTAHPQGWILALSSIIHGLGLILLFTSPTFVPLLGEISCSN